MSLARLREQLARVAASRDRERVTVRGDLHADADGAPVGEFLATATAFGGASHPALAERQETHTFKLHDGSIFGAGIAGGLDGSFAVLGGTGRYAGAQRTYTARQSTCRGSAVTARTEFVFDLRI